MALGTLTAEQTAAFEADGYLMIPGLFNREEADLMCRIARADRILAERAHDRGDREGLRSRISLDNELHDDIYAAIARSRRVVGAMEQLLGGEVYHYHHKMTMKEPRAGGAWEWHQDYGYWYNNGCLWPDMASVMVAVDRATRQNGCLQVIRASHKLGRLNHMASGEQTGADLEHVEAALKRLELVYCEMEPGDGLFFHCNTLHRSDANLSPNPRWTLICCYNTKRNDPFKEHGHPNYSPLEVWDDECVLEIGRRDAAALVPAG
ncbi:MAG: phytanoyl-CoA dioxygenase family protein [Armatimonadetes bacterium]|nr:phytanoyl-CoA dioxygenase family protein [Armatimonadota bacterium]MDE2206322.1 phytanoyl-CoA dioxygenase family protein [Armatimonadota bacterium]